MPLARLDSTGRNAELAVKAEAHRFECSNITRLYMVGRDMPAIAGLHNCCNLMDLSLANNRITKIEGLDALEQLRRLDLSSNQITDLAGIWHLTKLEALHLQGNALADMRALHLKQLKDLPALRVMYLQNLDRSKQNPCCRTKDYKAALLKALPKLKNLDGERCPHTLNYAELAAEMEDLRAHPEPNKQIEVPSVAPWLEGVSLELGPVEKDAELDAAGAKLVEALQACQALDGTLREEVAKYAQALEAPASQAP